MILKPPLNDIQLLYMDTDSFVLRFSKVNVSDEHIDLSKLDSPIKTNNKVPGNFKHEFGSKIIGEFITLSPKTYSFKHHSSKERGIKKCNKAKRKKIYYNAVIHKTEKTVEEFRMQKDFGR